MPGEMGEQLWVYTFYNNDDDSESQIWKCLATSDADAEERVRLAGIEKFTLFAKEPQAGDRSHQAVTAKILENPFLGEAWLPLIEAFEVVTDRFMERAGFILVQTLARQNNLKSPGSPYAQWLYESDNSLHVELAGNLMVNPPLTDEQLHQLQFLGWSVQELRPVEETFTLGGDENLPNPYRTFDPEYSVFEAMALTVEALTSIYGLIEEDFFQFLIPIDPEEIATVTSLVQPFAGEPQSAALLQIPQGALAFQQRILASRLTAAGFSRTEVMANTLHDYALTQPNPFKYLKEVVDYIPESVVGKGRLNRLYRKMEEEGFIPPIVAYEYVGRDYETGTIEMSGTCKADEMRKYFRHVTSEFLDATFTPLFELPDSMI